MAATKAEEPDKFEHIAAILTNVTRLRTGRALLLQSGRGFIQALVAQLKSTNLLRRQGCAAAFRNCCFSAEVTSRTTIWLLSVAFSGRVCALILRVRCLCHVLHQSTVDLMLPLRCSANSCGSVTSAVHHVLLSILHLLCLCHKSLTTGITYYKVSMPEQQVQTLPAMLDKQCKRLC